MEALRAEDPVQVGSFRLVGRLGTGGMGQVFLGESGGVLAAVKVVHDSHAADPRFRARFAREVNTGRTVRAPWAAAVLDADADAPRPWLATEYIAGPGLDRAVSVGGPLPADILPRLGARLATALAELHALRLMHRDVKPSNVLLAADGPRLIDFGIAKALDSTRLTHTGLAVGTPAFMSPEQATGEAESYPSDVFSLAAVLVFAVTGQGPFGRTTTPVAALNRIVNAAPELTAVAEPLRSVLAGCLAKNPAERPTAAALAEQLDALPGPAGAWPPPAVAAEIERARTDSRTLVAYSRSVGPVGGQADAAGWAGTATPPGGHPFAAASYRAAGPNGGPPSAAEFGRGTPPHGTAPHGSVSHGSAAHGSVSQGSAAHGSVSQGSAAHGSVPQGSAAHGSVPQGSAAHGSVPHGSAVHGSAVHGSVSHGSAAHGSVPHGSAPHGVPSFSTPPHGTRPRATRPAWLVPVLALGLVVVLLGGGATYLLTSGPDPEPIAAPPVPAAAPEPEPTAPAGPPKVISAPLVPSQVPGWTAAVSTTRNVAYDVPPGWKFGSPGQIKGFKAKDGTAVVMSGVAEHGSLSCPGEKYPQADAWSGVTGAPSADTARSARGMAQLWAGIYDEDSGAAKVQYGPVTEVTAGERTGSRVTATVTKPAGACGSPNATLTVVALPAGPGETVVYVLLADTDTIGEEQVQQTIGSLRPAGLQSKCDPGKKALGSWC